MYTIRLATLTDLPAIRYLWKAFAEEPRSYPHNIVGSLDDFTRHLALAMAQQPCIVFCFLAEEETTRRPVGFFLYEIQSRFYGEPKRYGFVHYAYVIEGYRRQGILSALVEMGVEHGLAQG